ncbi:MAG: hypothetical protein RSO15_12055, partial [Bacteroides sp.]|uniref:hypothetical protein n=1 Tax=Bacteroides sp. TaxID=29523 RepID=UPI002FC66BF1
ISYGLKPSSTQCSLGGAAVNSILLFPYLSLLKLATTVCLLFDNQTSINQIIIYDKQTENIFC